MGAMSPQCMDVTMGTAGHKPVRKRFFCELLQPVKVCLNYAAGGSIVHQARASGPA